GVAVAEKDVLYVFRIDAELLQLRYSDGFDFILEAGIDQHNAFRGRKYVHGRFRIADGIDVVENFQRFEIRRIIVLRSRMARDAIEVVWFSEELISTGNFPRCVRMLQRLRIVRLRRKRSTTSLTKSDKGNTKNQGRDQNQSLQF